jgi:hypothetical protein
MFWIVIWVVLSVIPFPPSPSPSRSKSLFLSPPAPKNKLLENWIGQFGRGADENGRIGQYTHSVLVTTTTTYRVITIGLKLLDTTEMMML